MPDTSYTNVSTHAQPLASGQVVAPGETAALTDDPHDRALRDNGAFAPTETSTDYGAMKHDQLASLAEGAGLDVKPSGKSGTPTSEDLAKALTAHDAKTTKEA